MYTPKYLNVLLHDNYLPLQVVIQLQWTLNLGPIRIQDDFLTLMFMSIRSSSFSHTPRSNWSDDTEGAKSKISSAYKRILTQVYRT